MTLIDRRLLLGVLGALILIVVANNSSGALAQPQIGVAFGAGPADVGWVVFGSSATFAIGTALWGGLAGRFGLGPSLAYGVLLFAVGSALAALAPSLSLLIAARLIQGFGSGAIPTLATALIARRFHGVERARALGVTVAAVGTGLAIGPLLGGIALHSIGWQGAVAFGVVAAPTALLLYGTSPRDPTAERPIDFRGAGVTAIVVLAAIFVLNRFPVLGFVPLTIGVIAVLGIGVGVLAWRGLRKPDAFLPQRVVMAPAFVRVVVLGALGMSAFLGTLVLVPVAAADAHGLDGISLGLLLVPMAVTGAVCSLNNARLQVLIGRPATTVLALASLALGALSLAVMGAEAPPPVLSLALLPIGVGFGFLGPPLLNELTQNFSEHDQPIAVGAYNLFFFLGGALGAAISTALLQARVDLAFLAGRSVPGFSTAELLLALAPAVAAALLLTRLFRVQRRVVPG
ncbi:MFS transporter [soil metagenome]